MAGGAVCAGAVSVLLRRAAVRRLIVLGGLLIAGWLLGCAAQQAHAEEVPAAPARAVAKTPLLEHVVEVATERLPVPRVVRTVAEKQPPEEKVTQDALPPPEVAAPRTAEVAVAPEVRPRAHDRSVSKVARSAPVGGDVSHQVVRHQPVTPLQAPESDGQSSAAGGLVMHLAAGFPSVRTRAPAPPRASVPRVSGAVPPAVRTAADEPSFVPD